MSQNSDTPAADKIREKALREADREARIVAFLSAMPDDMEPSEMECAVIAIANAHMPDELLPNFFIYLAMRLKGRDVADALETTTH
jgi:hypothetical protein